MSTLAHDQVALPGVLVRFPLVRRPHLSCPPLQERVHQVASFTQAAHRTEDRHEQKRNALAAWNMAALIAADCGLPGLAARWCEHQFRLLHPDGPVPRPASISALQPLLNLTRLTARSGDPQRAYQELSNLRTSALHGGSVRIHGFEIHFDEPAKGTGGDGEVCSWLDRILLQDGTRLLARTGQWDRAAEHARRHARGTGRVDEFCQTQAIAHLVRGRVGPARKVLDAAMADQLWEHAVIACLHGCVDLSQYSPAPPQVAHLCEVTQAARAREATEPATALFRLRLSLVTAGLLAASDPSQADLWCAQLIAEAVTSDDAFLSKEMLSCPVTRQRLAPHQELVLTQRVRAAGLDQGELPRTVATPLAQALDIAGEVLLRVREPSG